MDRPQYELAEADYKNGMKYKDIAEKYEVSINTVKSWKTRYKWNKKSVHTKEKKVCTQNNSKNNKKSTKKELIAEEVKEVLENTELTEKQRLFCIYYIKHFNATKAYKEVYECDYKSATVSGPRLLGKVSIKKEIQRLTKECLEEEEVEAKLLNKRLLEMYMKIAFSDIGDD